MTGPGDLAMIELSVLLGEGRHLGVFSRMHSNEADVDLGLLREPTTIRRGSGRSTRLPAQSPLGEIGGGQMRVFRAPIELNGKLYAYFGAFDGLQATREPGKGLKTQWVNGTISAAWDGLCGIPTACWL